MKAILTKYISPSNTRGARIKAYDMDNNSATISYPYELSGEDVHRAAACALITKMQWNPKPMVGGEIPGGYAFVFVQ